MSRHVSKKQRGESSAAAPSSSPPVTTTIRLRSKKDGSSEYGAFTAVTVDILVDGNTAGHIQATLINRQQIPDGQFSSAMDSESAAFESIGSRIYEHRRGRPKLQSMAEYDNDELDILYIEKMHVDDRWKTDGNSDVGAEALRLMLHHRRIRGGKICEQNGVWSASSAVYELDPHEAMTEREKTDRKRREEEEEDSQQDSTHGSGEPTPAETEKSLRRKKEEDSRMDVLARADANQFLRNGFFQDEAVGRKDERYARILVATYGQWSQTLKSHDEVSSVQLYVPPPKPDPPTGKDSEILNFINHLPRLEFECRGLGIDEIKTEIRRLVADGGSLLRSNALHAVIKHNNRALVDFILETAAPSTVNSVDTDGLTPLMRAALSAVGRQNIDGMPETRIIDRLLRAGAQRGLTTSSTTAGGGMTAFGVLVKQMSEMGVTMSAENGWAGTDKFAGGRQPPGLREIASKLIPPNGPTAADLLSKETPNGYIDYSDDERDSSDDDDY